jgi:hypothetical protein
MSDDPKITQRYRELPREEPPRPLDDAILAAARRSVAPRRSRWYVPVAAAAVIVLAVAVTMNVDRERPREAESVVAMKAEPAAPAPEKPAVKGFVPDPKPQAAPDPVPPQMADRASAQGREEYERRAAAADLARLQADMEQSRAERRAAAEAGVQRERESPAAASAMRRERMADAAPARGPAAHQSPEQWLLAIDDLKRQGRHEEAEKQLAEFRKRNPSYRIPEAITEKFEKAR